MSLQGQRVLVIGGSSGMGEAGVRALAAVGARVVMADRKEAPHDLGAELVLTIDIADDDQIGSVVAKAGEHLGGLDAVWNNAGICHVGTVESMELQAFDLSFALNVRANAVLARAALPRLREAGGGSLLFTASAASIMVAKGSLPYIVSKSALLTMTRQLALEYAGDNIRVNALCPGWVDTPFNAPVWEMFGGRESFLQKVPELVPLHRMGTVGEFGAIVRFILSEDARFMTGQAVVVDGGESLIKGPAR
ncbi:SDR family NAD(P)-dependent oxidoreductase [Mesorhizobium sp. 113-3-3]|uniref:SDR family NAD(P)-dependent oxidoreductase n=1 Tax=Mesorhizobium sp. 113-3-3 TaxID=2744516 RepID=UPI0019275FAF|nr:SDR family oxidoreductase [Mesorhizobium sp. 113-3-3]BCG82176.1 oxidoreductase [Mesorhizobium sp. 113-3-3]